MNTAQKKERQGGEVSTTQTFEERRKERRKAWMANNVWEQVYMQRMWAKVPDENNCPSLYSTISECQSGITGGSWGDIAVHPNEELLVESLFHMGMGSETYLLAEVWRGARRWFIQAEELEPLPNKKTSRRELPEVPVLHIRFPDEEILHSFATWLADAGGEQEFRQLWQKRKSRSAANADKEVGEFSYSHPNDGNHFLMTKDITVEWE